jgi:hypothetical protein
MSEIPKNYRIFTVVKEELKQVVLLSLPTIGLPSMMATLNWIDDIIEEI